MRKRRSKIWILNKEEFQKLCDGCNSLADILRYFAMHVGAANYSTLKRRIKEESIDISHIPLGLGSNKNRGRGGSKPFPLEQILVKKSNYQSSRLRKRLIAEGLLENKCSICGLGSEWQGKPIAHRLDHINGDHYDNRLENLRIVCANCDTQLPTYGSKNIKKTL